MNKQAVEEIQKELVDSQNEINLIITKAIMLSKEEMTKLEHLYSKMESLKFKLQKAKEDESDGVK